MLSQLYKIVRCRLLPIAFLMSVSVVSKSQAQVFALGADVGQRLCLVANVEMGARGWFGHCRLLVNRFLYTNQFLHERVGYDYGPIPAPHKNRRGQSQIDRLHRTRRYLVAGDATHCGE